MSRVDRITIRFVDLVPTTLDEGILYVSNKYKTASHLCCCGCGNRVVTPLKPGGWTLQEKNGHPSLHPSIGNSNFCCRSHYWIRDGRVVWTRVLSDMEIKAARTADQRDREAYFDRSQGWWASLVQSLSQLGRAVAASLRKYLTGR